MTAMAAFVALLLVPRPAAAQDAGVFTDPQGVRTYTNLPASHWATPAPARDKRGVQTYTNVPPSRRARPEPAKDVHGVRLYTNVPPSSVGNHRTHHEPGEDSRAEPSEGPMPASGGQWVYTKQYGWLWMPYGARYVSEGSAGDAAPYAFVYQPTSGWTWLAAPWVWGRGPYPYFGALGPGRFGWYRGLLHARYGWGGYR